MGKPSITNIKPPSSTAVWTPPKTTWDLDAAADILAAGSDLVLDSEGNWVAKVSTVNTIEPSALEVDTANLIANYDYIFFGVNGGEDETVQGKRESAGILVTGNGKDHVTGGNLGDVIWSGNGADVDHGGAGNDIIFGENGPDQLWGDSDNGTASFTPAQEGQLVIKDDVDILPEDPNGDVVAIDEDDIPGKTKVEKVGVYVALDSEGNPTELDGDGNPVVHVVYSITAGEDVDGDFTVAYSHGNQLDGPGDPDPDQFFIHLVAGNVYYFSFITGGTEINVDVFPGHIIVTSPINDGPDGNPGSIATSQGMPPVDWASLFDETGGAPAAFDFTEGDQLVGGNGPDQFIYDLSDATSVDIIWDYNQGDGTYNVLEGDVVRLVNATQQDLDDAQIFTDYDIDGDGNNDLVILFSTNHAIGLVGINDIADVTFVFGAP
jgi:hypothetical protein